MLSVHWAIGVHSLIDSENRSLVLKLQHLNGSGTSLENKSLPSPAQRARIDGFTCVSIYAMLSLDEIPVVILPFSRCPLSNALTMDELGAAMSFYTDWRCVIHTTAILDL